MGPKLCPKVILEGTRLTHKTDIAFRLNEHPEFVGPRKYRYHSPIVSAEWCALTNQPWGRGLINFLPEEAARAVEAYHTWVRLFELLPYYSWIIDRFHISTRAYQIATHAIDYDFGWLDERLANLGFHLVLCTRRGDTFAAARTERLKVSGKPSQYDDLTLFKQEQENLRMLAGASQMPRLELDVSDSDVNGAADRIVEWMRETGGLWAK